MPERSLARGRLLGWNSDVNQIEATEMGLFGGRKRRDRLDEAGVNAQAVLVSFREVGQQNFTPLVDLALRITPADGGGPFEVTVRTQIEFSVIGNLQPGDVFSVRYDPEDHANFELGERISSAGPEGAEQSLDSASAGEIAAAVQATGETRGNADRRLSSWRADSG